VLSLRTRWRRRRSGWDILREHDVDVVPVRGAGFVDQPVGSSLSSASAVAEIVGEDVGRSSPEIFVKEMADRVADTVTRCKAPAEGFVVLDLDDIGAVVVVVGPAFGWVEENVVDASSHTSTTTDDADASSTHPTPHTAARLGNIHMQQPIRLNCLIAEPRTVTRPPFSTAHHTEFGRAATCDVVTPLHQLYHVITIVKRLPSLLFRHFDELLRRRIFGAFAAGVPFAITGTANFHRTSLACAVLPPAVRSPRPVDSDIVGFDPATAPARRAVDAVFCGEFLVFAVPAALEAVVVEFLDVSEVDVFGGAAFGRHVRRVRDAEVEKAPEAAVAHVVVTGKVGGFRFADRVHAGQAFDSVRGWSGELDDCGERRGGWVPCLWRRWRFWLGRFPGLRGAEEGADDRCRALCYFG